MARGRLPVSKKVQVLTGSLISFAIFILLWIFAEPFMIILLWVFFTPMTASSLSGLIKGLFYKEWDTLKFSWKIFEGNFIIEENSTFKKGVSTIVSRLIWEQPQTMIGNFGMHVLNSVWLIRRIDVWKRALVLQGTFLRGGGIALGSFIFIDLQNHPTVNIFPMDERTVPGKILIRHEYGHTLQSVSSGPLFIFKYGIPSILMQGWTEPDADYRSDMDLLHKDQIMPVFFTHREQRKEISPAWWEFTAVPLIMLSGYIINETNGLIGSILITIVLITTINLSKPAS